jgi:hypothetical protein
LAAVFSIRGGTALMIAGFVPGFRRGDVEKQSERI